MAIDRSKIPEILKGDQIPATSFVPPGMIGHNPELGFKFDPERARELLAQAGYKASKNLPPITLAFNTLDTNQLICEFVQAQWQSNLGITVYLRNMEWKVYLKELEMDPPAAFRLGWYADYPDPTNFAEIFLSSGGNNHTRFKSREYDDLVAQAPLKPTRKSGKTFTIRRRG
jgi:oligopeptide transport system substrate-binding protein